jgi:anti-anti-sigma factor
MEIRESTEGGVRVLAPDGSVAGLEETGTLESKLGAAIKAGALRLVIDCSAAGQLNSAAIRILLQVSRKLDRTDGRLVLCGMNAKVRKVFLISGFDKDFTVVATREEALQRVLESARLAPRTARVAPAREAAEEQAPPAPPEAAPIAASAGPVPASAPPTSPPPPDPREALAAALLDALGVHAVHPASARLGGAALPDLETLANGVLAAVRVRTS